MYIRFDQVREAPVAWDESVELCAVDLEVPSLLAIAPVRCRGTATEVAGGMHLHADLEVRWTLRCVRCLESFDDNIELEVDLLLLEGERTEQSVLELELEEDDFGVLHVTEEGVESDPLVGEQVALSLPMKPLCRGDCAGLCPRCGRRLNHDHCSCERSAPDPRFSALAEYQGPARSVPE